MTSFFFFFQSFFLCFLFYINFIHNFFLRLVNSKVTASTNHPTEYKRERGAFINLREILLLLSLNGKCSPYYGFLLFFFVVVIVNGRFSESCATIYKSCYTGVENFSSKIPLLVLFYCYIFRLLSELLSEIC